MIRYICKKIEDIDYVCDKYNSGYTKEEYVQISYYIKMYENLVIYFQDNKIKYCSHENCLDCSYEICDIRFSNIINTKYIMREEKLNRILNE